jgi:hypothetical protein
MIRIVLVFLVVVLILGWIGKWRLPRVPQRRPGPAVQSARKCPDCDAYVLGSHPEPCARPDCRFRRAPASARA